MEKRKHEREQRYPVGGLAEFDRGRQQGERRHQRQGLLPERHAVRGPYFFVLLVRVRPFLERHEGVAFEQLDSSGGEVEVHVLAFLLQSFHAYLAVFGHEESGHRDGSVPFGSGILPVEHCHVAVGLVEILGYFFRRSVAYPLLHVVVVREVEHWVEPYLAQRTVEFHVSVAVQVGELLPYPVLRTRLVFPDEALLQKVIQVESFEQIRMDYFSLDQLQRYVLVAEVQRDVT